MGPLKGLKIIEMAGIGPGPFCGMVLADLGAEIIRVDRASAIGGGTREEPANRGKRSIAVDLKSQEGVEVILKLVEKSDAIFEGFRPGVMEKLGLGPDECFKQNKALIYGRMTGWGQDGPMSKMAGHDINYIGLSGALHAIGKKDSNPTIPLNLIGDYGGGGMMLAMGILAAVISSIKTGKGQVVDSAMIDGSLSLMSFFYSLKEMGFWQDKRESNFLDGAAHFYNTYECSDNKYLAVGSLEPQFYSILLEKLELNDVKFQDQMNKEIWQELKDLIADKIKSKPRSHWENVFSDTDGCVTPILNMDEAQENHHNVARNAFEDIDGFKQPAPAPRFSIDKLSIKHNSKKIGSDIDNICEEFNLDRKAFI